jgi:hypothetical protein
MQIFSAKDAKYGFGRLIVIAGAGWVAVAKHARPVVVVLAIEQCERLKSPERPTVAADETGSEEKTANDC